jgi:parvulin-like peptidyl-prolyl isomerase
MTRSVLALVASGFACLACAAFGAEKPTDPEGGSKGRPPPPKPAYEQAVVTVNERAVTRSYLRLMMHRQIKRLEGIRAEQKARGLWTANDDKAYKQAMYKLRLRAVREVVFGEILRREAERLVKMGFKVPKHLIEKYWRDQLKRAGGAGELARKQGLSVAALKEMSKDQIMAEAYRDNLRSTMAKPTPQEVADYYKFHSEVLRKPESVRARVIFIKRFIFDPASERNIERKTAKARAERVLAKLKAGKDFAKLAKRYSEDPKSAASGGLIGSRKKNFLVSRGKFERALDEAIFSRKPGKLGEVVKGPANYYVVKVVKHIPAGVPPLEEVEREVYNRCYMDRIRKAEERLFKQNYKTVLVRDSKGRRIPLEDIMPKAGAPRKGALFTQDEV